MGIMRHHDQRAGLPALLERRLAALPERVVADGGDFVNEITVELDRQRHREGQPRAHARRIGFDRHVQIPPELGEGLDIIQGIGNVAAIDAGNEARIIRPGETALKRAAEIDMPRRIRPLVGNSMPAIRRVRVDLPAPFAPTTPIARPRSITKDCWSSTRFSMPRA